MRLMPGDCPAGGWLLGDSAACAAYGDSDFAGARLAALARLMEIRFFVLQQVYRPYCPFQSVAVRNRPYTRPAPRGSLHSASRPPPHHKLSSRVILPLAIFWNTVSLIFFSSRNLSRKSPSLESNPTLEQAQ